MPTTAGWGHVNEKFALVDLRGQLTQLIHSDTGGEMPWIAGSQNPANAWSVPRRRPPIPHSIARLRCMVIGAAMGVCECTN
jgi:hypothetical protein